MNLYQFLQYEQFFQGNLCLADQQIALNYSLLVNVVYICVLWIDQKLKYQINIGIANMVF